MLDLIQITKIFNKGTLNEKTALDDVSLHLNNGDFTTVIGGNGAGKSTLLNAIAGSFLVDKGRIFLDETDITFCRSTDAQKYRQIISGSLEGNRSQYDD